MRPNASKGLIEDFIAGSRCAVFLCCFVARWTDCTALSGRVGFYCETTLLLPVMVRAPVNSVSSCVFVSDRHGSRVRNTDRNAVM